MNEFGVNYALRYKPMQRPHIPIMYALTKALLRNRNPRKYHLIINIVNRQKS